ncbi:hypothetical protein MN608_11504 [Microdochium nivale]|nr:hypothetical protein MN608_11504 [Microdochium nivale]
MSTGTDPFSARPRPSKLLQLGNLLIEVIILLCLALATRKLQLVLNGFAFSCFIRTNDSDEFRRSGGGQKLTRYSARSGRLPALAHTQTSSFWKRPEHPRNGLRNTTCIGLAVFQHNLESIIAFLDYGVDLAARGMNAAPYCRRVCQPRRLGDAAARRRGPAPRGL